jgi:ASC-1-like (ASCH) protein
MLSANRKNIPKKTSADEKQIPSEKKNLGKNKRFKYFSEYHEKALKEIQDYIQANKDSSKLILPSAVEDMARGLSDLLDEYTIKFLDNDIKRYRKDPANKIDINKLSATEAIQELDKYYEKHKDLKYPAYDPLMSTLANNYKNKMILLIERLTQDIKLIHDGFNKKTESQLIVSHILQTGSDLHRQGGQVLIIEFSNNTDNSNLKIVYKPSSVEADAFITGDINRLSSLDKEYENCKSFVEVINHGLDSLEKRALPTYLIIPKKQFNDAHEVEDRYGYIEFISHSPWQAINCAEHLEKLIKENSPRVNHEIAGEIDRYYQQQFEEMLKTASADDTCNYVLRTSQEEEDFSFACGCLITVMTTLGIIDMHIENMIVSNKLPVLIDLESSFRIDAMTTIKSTLAFEINRGSFSHKSTTPKEFAQLYNISGLQTPAIEMIEKNRSYTVFQIKNNKAVPYALAQQTVLDGISVTLDIFKNQKELFDKWFQDIKGFDICVRYIPAKTSLFSEFREKIMDKLITDKKSLDEAVAEFKMDISDPSTMENDPLKEQFISIFHKNVVERVGIELSQGNIPAYFTSITSNQLYDFTNQLIPKVGSVEIEEPTSHLETKSDEESFFPIPCYTHIEQRFSSIVQNIDNEKQRLSQELQERTSHLQSLDSKEINKEAINADNQSKPDNDDDSRGCCKIM